MHFCSYPKSSNAINIDVIGQFVTPQNTAAIPVAAHIEGEIPAICPKRHPNVAPTKNEGTISPPLNPASIVNAVKTIFHIKATGFTFPLTASSIGLPQNALGLREQASWMHTHLVSFDELSYL